VSIDGEEASTTLSWSSRGAESVRIDPDIGIVDANGSMTVAPLQTTTYTISATKDGETAADSVTVTVIDLTAVPTVTLSALPATIVRGASATLSWSATNVTSVTLDNQSGALPMTGSLVVAPFQTTTYTVTTTNAAGTATASATIAVTDPPPTVTFSANPVQIRAGEAATLAWSATLADTVSIDPGIGSVDPSGTLAVTPNQTTTYTITAIGSGGTTTASATVSVSNPISLQITSPAHGLVVSAPSVSVTGTLTHADGFETGLTVNGTLAVIDGDRFTADHVPLLQGENTLTATATDAAGITLTDSVKVYAELPEDYIQLSADPVSGTSPFETTLHIDSSFEIASSQISYQGPGEVQLLDRTIDEYRLEISTSGVYTFGVAVTDQRGHAYSDDVTVKVIDEAALDALLQAKWAGMKAALMAGDVQGALAYHHEYSRERYGAIYNALGDELPALVGQMQAISWICYVDGTVKYRIRQNHEINGEVVTVTYYIYFSRGENGLWLIERY